MQEEGVTPAQSKMNGAFMELVRIDKLFDQAHQKRAVGNLLGWNQQLDSIWAELASGLNERSPDHKALIDKIKNLNTDLVKNKNHRGKLNQILIEKHITLKRIQDKQGKGTAFKDDSEDDFE